MAQETAETPTAPEADLAALRANADRDPDSYRMILDLLGRVYKKDGNDKLSMEAVRNVISRDVTGGRMSRGKIQSFDYVLAAQIDLASDRTQQFGSILLFDQNGDWQVTKEEIVTIAAWNENFDRVKPMGFLDGDSNGDDTLTIDEIIKFIDSTAGRRNDVQFLGQRMKGAALLDMNNDGVLTKDEFDRAVAALQVIAQSQP